MSIWGTLKAFVVKDEYKPRTILLGPMKGLSFNLNLRHNTQMILGLYETETFPFMRRVRGGFKVALDVGCNAGTETILFASQENVRKVYSFEPEQKHVNSLFNNLALNPSVDRKKVELIGKFASDRDDSQNMRLDSIPIEEGPVFVKIDVDGGETSVLAGAANLIARHDVAWLIETHSVELEKECASRLREAGYAVTIIPNAWWRLIVPERRTIAHNRWLFAERPSSAAPSSRTSPEKTRNLESVS